VQKARRPCRSQLHSPRLKRASALSVVKLVICDMTGANLITMHSKSKHLIKLFCTTHHPFFTNATGHLGLSAGIPQASHAYTASLGHWGLPWVPFSMTLLAPKST
jgi:hypothetical protein